MSDQEAAAGQWRAGSPPHPWDGEWFLAETIHGEYVVLRPLPEEFAYDFTTADRTYTKRSNIKRWAQLSGSSYVAPAVPELLRVGYIGSAGLYRTREEAVRNGEQLLRRVYEIKDE